MRMKKTWFSYLLWFLYAIITGSLLATHTIRLLTGTWEFNKYIAAGCIALCFASIAFICLAGRELFIFLSRRISLDEHSRNMWECFFVMSTFAAALLYRIRYILYYKDAAEVTEYYRMAQITGDSVIAGNIHGASYVYTVLLSSVFSFMGNKVMAGIVLQLVLQILAMLFIYFAVRIIAGRIAALTVLGFMAFTTVFVSDIYRLEPQSLYLLFFAIGLWLTGLSLKGVYLQSYRQKACYALFALLGIYIGIVAYLDILGIALFLFVGLGFLHKDRKNRKKEKAECAACSFGLQFLAVLAGMLFIMALFLFLYARNSGQSFFHALSVWTGQYGIEIDTGRFFCFFGMSPFESFIISFLSSFLIVGFWINKRQRTDAWMLLLILYTAAYTGGAVKMETGSFAVVLWGVLAGFGIRSIGTEELIECTLELPAGECDTEAKDLEEGNGMEMIKDITIEELDAEPKIRFIENPLPLPKKHVPREMNYGLDVTDEDLDFDVHTNEYDDFDL